MATLFYKRFKGTGQVGKLPILIAFFSIFDGVLAVARVEMEGWLFNTNDDVSFDSKLVDYEVVRCLEYICFLGAFWFYSIKYYETAQDLKNMLNMRRAKNYLTPRRKRNCLIIRWAIFIVFIVMFQVLTCISMLSREAHQSISMYMFIISTVTTALTLISITVLTSLALYTFVKVASSNTISQEKLELNSAPVLVQILGLAVLMSSLIAKNTIYLIYFDDVGHYRAYRDVTINEIVCFMANLFNFMIIAFVIYKSSKVVGLQHDPILKKDVSLLAYMRN